MRSILRIHGGVDKGRAAGLLSRRWPRASLAPHVDALGQAREAWGGAGPGFAFSGLELARGLQCMSLDDAMCLRAWDGWAGDTEGGGQKARESKAGSALSEWNCLSTACLHGLLPFISAQTRMGGRGGGQGGGSTPLSGERCVHAG